MSEVTVSKNIKEVDYTQISKKANIILNIIMILISICCIFPLLLVIAVSFTDNNAIAKYGYSLIPKVFSTYAYEFIFENAAVIFRAYGVTIFVTLVGSVVSLIIIAMYAYPLSRKEFRYRKLFSMLVVFTMLFSGGLVPLYMVYCNMLHVNDTLIALIIPYLMTPLYVLIMRTFFVTTIPDAIIEAARIDGAGEFSTFVKIVIPLAKPSLATIGLFNVLQYWNDWQAPFLYIRNEKLFNLQYQLYKIQNQIIYLQQMMQNGSVTVDTSRLPSETARMALAIVAIGPIILAYPFFQRYFVSGLTIGGVKG